MAEDDPPNPASQAFLADLAADPVRPGQLGDEWSPKDVRDLRSALPARPLVDGPARASYVLGSFNRRALLEQAIRSIREDCTGIDAEIIVVDGGSTDGSIEWICSQQDVIGIIQHNRYLRDGSVRRRMSWGRFMNIAFRAASSDWIAMISDDCYVLPGATSAALSRIEEAQAAGLRVGGCAFYYRDWPMSSRYFVQRTLGGNLMVNHGFFSRSALAEIGYANEYDFAFYKADTDLSLRIWQAGYAIIDCTGSICEHYVSPAEAARQANNAMMEYDRGMMRLRWPGLIGQKARKMGPKYLDFVDPLETARKVFGPVLDKDLADQPPGAVAPAAGTAPDAED